MTAPEPQNTTRSKPRRSILSFRTAVTLPSLKAHVIFWSITSAGLALDLWTKSAVFGWLHGKSPGYTLIGGFLKIVTTENPGAAFGIAYGLRPMLIIVSVIALLAIIGFFLLGNMRNTIAHVALGLFAAGVCGNLYDRIFNDGLVRDFIDVVYWPGKHWPAFNIADSMLCIAVALLLISTYAADHKH
jgi:signal peptidase II